MKRIGVFPGGGAMGMISLACWAEIVKKTGKPLHELLDLGVGTSIGALIWGILSTGEYCADELLDRFDIILPKVFKKKFFRFYPKYRRKYVSKEIDRVLGRGFPMRHCQSKCLITSIRAEDKRNHFFKSWQLKDSTLPVKEAITRSYAAPLYFGKWVSNGSTWLDGGAGSMNTPIIPAIWEAMRLGWLNNEPVHIISVGTGFTPEITAHDKMQKIRWLKELSLFFDPADGGLARYQSRNDNISAAKDLSDATENFSFQHIDTQLSKKMNRIDGVKYLDDYYKLGKKMAETVDYEALLCT